MAQTAQGATGGAAGTGQATTGGQAGGAVSTGGAASGGAGGETPASGGGGGGTPAKGCLDVSPALSSAELAAAVERQFGVRVEPSRLELPGATPTVRGLSLTEAIEEALRDAEVPLAMSQILRDFVIAQLLHDASYAQGMPQFDGAVSTELAAALDQELEHSLDHWLNDGRATLRWLLTDNTAFVNATLAEHYGIAGPAGSEFLAVSRPLEAEMGVLTRGAFLARYSDPPSRSQHLVTALECLLVPPLPQLMSSLWEDPERGPAKQVIERSYGGEQVTCRTCHEVYVGYAIALDRYDELGRYREAINGVPIDVGSHLRVPSATPETTSATILEFSGPQALGLGLSEAPVVRKCFIERLVERLGLAQLDSETLACVREAFDRTDASMTSLLAILAPRLVTPR